MNFTMQGQTASSLILRKNKGEKVSYIGKEFLVEYQVVAQELIVPK